MATDISGLRRQIKQSEFKGHPVLKLVAHRVKSVRTKKNITKDLLCELARINNKTLNAIEKGNRNYTIYNLLSVMNALKISSLHKKKKQIDRDDIDVSKSF